MLILLLATSVLAAQRCPVYTYYTDLTEAVQKDSWTEQERIERLQYDHRRLVEIWKRNWYANGWQPIVLNQTDSRQHPRYAEYGEKFAKLPTVNNPRYERACYERWLAFAQRGGGLFVDYDLVNYPRSLLPPSAGPCGRGPLISYPELLPMLLMGEASEVESLLEAFYNWEVDPQRDVHGGRPHISDMIIARRQRHELFDRLLPNPPGVAHFNTDTFWQMKGVCQEEMERVSMRYEWMNANLACEFKRGKTVYLVGASAELEDHFGKDCEYSPACLIAAFRPDVGDGQGYQFIKTMKVPADIADNEFIIIMLPTPAKRTLLVRLWQWLYGGGDPLKELLRDSSRSMGELLTHPNVFVGLEGYPYESIAILEHTIGYQLPPIRSKRQSSKSDHPIWRQVFQNLMERHAQIGKFE